MHGTIQSRYTRQNPMDVGGRKACLHLSLVEVMLDTKAARRGSETVEVAARIPVRTSPETIQA